MQELGDIEITSVSKHQEKASKVASALFVITQEDIRRSRATSIPEILRIVPGLEVLRVSSNSWAVSARGFNGVYASKLLVLIDGKSIFSTLYGGVNWDQTDLLIDDIERIEVIRGPGATVWGANAVNGVINIISKKPKDQLGKFITLGGGSEDLMSSGARISSQVSDDAYLKLYAKSFIRDDSRLESGARNFDGWKAIQSGFR